MDFSKIPSQLKQDGLFCLWKLTDGKKLPINPHTNGMAMSSNPNTFSSWDIVLPKIPIYEKYDIENGRLLGGLGFGIFNGFSAIDIDDCVKDGTVSPMAQDIIDYCKSYTEYSPSGKGIRIIFKTNTVLNKELYYIKNSNLGLEIYLSEQTKRYVTLTGNTLNDNDIQEVDISYILEKYMKREKQRKITTGDIVEDVNIAVKNFLKNYPPFNELWNSKAPGSGSNESELDQSLCNFLANCLDGNYTAIEQAFIQSPYFQSKDDHHKKKWLERTDYREQTIKNAINSYHTYKLTKLEEFELNDTGNAKKFVENFKSIIRYNVDNNMWMIWNGKYWEDDKVRNIKNFAEVIIEQERQAVMKKTGDERKAYMKNIQRLMSSSGKEAMIKESQHLNGIPVLNSDFDKETYLLNTKNGIIDLRNGSIREHDMNAMLSQYTDIGLNKIDKPVRWLKFLNEIFEGNQEMIDYIQMNLGYGLTGETKEQSWYVYLGDGANGKSLLFSIYMKILGDYAKTTKTDIILDRTNTNQRDHSLSALNKARVVLLEEADLGVRLAESAVKSLTSDYGEIVTRRLYGNEFTYKPTFKIFMATNHKPIIRGQDNGIWRRLSIIKFNRIFKAEEQDRDLGEKLWEERDSIFWWLVQGAIKWYREGYLPRIDAIKDNVSEYRSEMDVVQRWVNENCDVEQEYVCRAKDLYLDFTKFCKENNEYILSNHLFGANLSKKFDKKRTGDGIIYSGLKLKDKTLIQKLDDIKVDSDI